MCGPSVCKAASGKLAGLVQYNVGLASVHARMKIGVLGLIYPSSPPSAIVRREIAKCYKGWLSLFAPGTFRFQQNKPDPQCG